MRVLVTGASGFVGANLARHLVISGQEVHLLVRKNSDLWRLADLLPDVHIHTADLSDQQTVNTILSDCRPQQTFHLAVHGAYPQQTDPRAMVHANLLGTMNLVEAALASGCEVIVNTGSSSEYGFKDHAPLETERPEPNSHYAVTKAAATMYCQYVATSRKVHIPTLRLYSVYGPYEEPTRLMPTLILRGLQGEWPPLVSPDIARDYVYIDDVVSAYQAAGNPQSDGAAIYNVGSGVQTTLGEVAAVAQRVLAINAEPVWGSMEARVWDASVWVSDPSKLKACLNWRPKVDFAGGFSTTVDWFRQHPDLQQVYRSRQPAVS